MPLHDDSPELSAFRQIAHSPVFSEKRDTKGVPASAADLTKRFFLKLKIKTENEGKIVESNWQSCVPKRFADKSSPQNVRMGVLYVNVRNPSVKQEIMFSEREILANVKKLDGCSKIKKIRFL